MEQMGILSTEELVKLQITTSKDEIGFSERRFAKDISISTLKNKLEMITGAGGDTMHIELYTKDNQLICSLSNNEAMLGSYPVEDNMRLHIVDKFLLRNEFDNLNNVQKYEMSDEAYSKKNDSVRSFLIKNKMGQYNEEFQRKKEIQESKEHELTESMPIGARCKVSVKNTMTRLGTIMFKGVVEGLPGSWIGVKYDEPLGKNDGTLKGVKYFECPPNYGAFVKAVYVEIGDFPPEDYDLSDEI